MMRIFLVIGVLILVSCAESDPAIEVVAARVVDNNLGIRASELLSMDNPRGEGHFVYVKRTRFSGVKRNLIWVVVDGRGFALNGPSKGVTPSLPWPREAPEEVWSRTGLNPYGTSEAIELVFGQQ